jgi:hypothetical protein
MKVGVESDILQWDECIVKRHIKAGREMIVACMQCLGIEVH